MRPSKNDFHQGLPSAVIEALSQFLSAPDCQSSY